MLSQTGYQESDMYPTQQLSLPLQKYLQIQWQQTYTRSVCVTNDICHLQQMARGNRS